MYHFKFADIGEGLHEGKILSLNIKENDVIKKDDVMFLVETDKVNSEITAPICGKVVKVNFQEGDVIRVGDIVLVIDDNHNKSFSKEKDTTNESSGVVGDIVASSNLLSSLFQIQEATTSCSVTQPLISPLARKAALQANLTIQTIQGTGPNNRILLADVQLAKQKLQASSKQKEAVQNIIDDNIGFIKMSTIRKTIARNMIQAKNEIPEVTVFRKINISKLVSYRQQLKAEYEIKNIKLTYLPFIMKAIGRALINFPMLNSVYDCEKEQIVYKKTANIGIAIDGPKGLVVFVIRDVNNKTLLNISQQLSEFITKTQEDKLTISDMSDGSFTITNYGITDIEYGTPIIRYPETAIFGMGKIFKELTMHDDQSLENIYQLPISLTIDHRVIDGGDSGRFLQLVANYLATPQLLV